MKEMFAEFNNNNYGTICFSDWKKMVTKLGVTLEKINVENKKSEEEQKEPCIKETIVFWVFQE